VAAKINVTAMIEWQGGGAYIKVVTTNLNDGICSATIQFFLVAIFSCTEKSREMKATNSVKAWI
jgi:hypothetical protein